LIYFLVVIALSVAAAAALWFFNVSIQLTPEELAEQRQLWKKHGPSDYFLGYLRLEDEESTGKFYQVEVRGGKVTQAREHIVNVRAGREIDPPGEGRPLSAEEAQEHTMDRLFDLVQAQLDEDQKAGRRVYRRARFHPDNGALLEFVHRPMGTRQRLQISVQAFKF
jgi:hypothetical protein